MSFMKKILQKYQTIITQVCVYVIWKKNLLQNIDDSSFFCEMVSHF